MAMASPALPSIPISGTTSHRRRNQHGGPYLLPPPRHLHPYPHIRIPGSLYFSPPLPPCWTIRQKHRAMAMAMAFPGNWSQESLQDAKIRDFTSWLRKQGFPEQAVDLKLSESGELGCFAARNLQAGEFAIKVPENFTVTSADVANHPVISQLAVGKPDLVGLALWLVYERGLGEKSLWYPYLKTFPSATLSPILWSESEQETLLKGTSIAEEVQQRSAYLEDEFTDILETCQNQLKDIPEDLFTVESFKNAFAVIVSRAIYLPSAELYALVPFGDAVNITGKSDASFEYSVEQQAVVLKLEKDHKQGEQVLVSYGQNRPNSDLLISYGFVDDNNTNDFLLIEVGLVQSDPLRSLKLQILQVANFQDEQEFPLYLDRFPTQLLSYMRLARLQDSALIAKISFDKDIIVNEANEYEVLTLLLSECRNRLSNFDRSLDDEVTLMNSTDISAKEKVAAKLRYCEQKILTNTMAALRARLGPIRGVPTKSGMKDRNSDIKDMFGLMEQVASAPQNFLSNLMKGKD